LQRRPRTGNDLVRRVRSGGVRGRQGIARNIRWRLRTRESVLTWRLVRPMGAVLLKIPTTTRIGLRVRATADPRRGEKHSGAQSSGDGSPASVSAVWRGA